MEYGDAVQAVVRLVMAVFGNEAAEIGRRLIIAAETKPHEEPYADEELRRFIFEARHRVDEQAEP